MNRDTWRMTVELLGRTVLDVKLGRDVPAAKPADPPAPAAPAVADGPVTDRRSNPMIGFASTPAGVRRVSRGERPTIR